MWPPELKTFTQSGFESFSDKIFNLVALVVVVVIIHILFQLNTQPQLCHLDRVLQSTFELVDMRTSLWFYAAISVFFSIANINSQECGVNGVCEVNEDLAPKGSNEKGEPKKVDMNECFDRHPVECPRYLERGECDKNPGWMIINW